MKYCPCGTGRRYLDCCGLYLQKKMTPPTPELLMRSRYTAYVEKNADYIRRTMKEPALKKFSKKDIQNSKIQWQGLKIMRASFAPHDSNIGFVEFIATYRLEDTLYEMHENSEFHLINHQWYYVCEKENTA